MKSRPYRVAADLIRPGFAPRYLQRATVLLQYDLQINIRQQLYLSLQNPSFSCSWPQNLAPPVCVSVQARQRALLFLRLSPSIAIPRRLNHLLRVFCLHVPFKNSSPPRYLLSQQQF